jgi:hypothetical protein
LATPQPIDPQASPPLQTPPTPPTPQPIKTSSPAGRIFLVWLALVLLGVFLGVLASFFLPTFSLSSLTGSVTPNLSPSPSLSLVDPQAEMLDITPTLEVTPLSEPTATPSALLDLKWNMMTVKSPNPNFSSYKIYYPTTWNIKEYKNTPAKIDSGTSTLILSKGTATVTLLQQAASDTSCTYETSQYREFIKDSLVWRASPSINDNSYYEVCEKTADGGFTNSVKTGAIFANNLVDQQTVDEFNYILEKIIIE